MLDGSVHYQLLLLMSWHSDLALSHRTRRFRQAKQLFTGRDLFIFILVNSKHLKLASQATRNITTVFAI